MLHCAWEQRGHRTVNWIFDHNLDFIHILILEVDFRNTLFAQQPFLLETKLNFPASKEQLSVFVFYNSVWPCWVIGGTPFMSKRTLYMNVTKSRLFPLLLLKWTCWLQLYCVVRRNWRIYSPNELAVFYLAIGSPSCLWATVLNPYVSSVTALARLQWNKVLMESARTINFVGEGKSERRTSFQVSLE